MSLSHYFECTIHFGVQVAALRRFFGFESGSEALLLPFRQVRKAAKNALRTLRRNGIALEVGKMALNSDCMMISRRCLFVGFRFRSCFC